MEQARKYDLIEKQKQAKEREENKQVQNLLKTPIVQQERTQSRLELEKHDTIEDDRNKKIDQLEQKQKSVISNPTVEPKVKPVLIIDPSY
jgi:carbonic anhydrase